MEFVRQSIKLKDHICFLAMVFCFWFSIYIYIPIFGVYLETLDMAYMAIGVIMGGYGIMQILMRFPLGMISDQLENKEKQLLYIGFFMALLSAFCLIWFDSFIFIFIGRLLAGITASMWVVVTVLYSQYFVTNRSTQAMGILQFATVITQFLSMGISGYIVTQLGWKAPFWVGAIAACIGLFFAINIRSKPQIGRENNEEIKQGYLSQIRSVIRNKHLWIISVLSLLAHGILFITIFGFTPIYYTTLSGNDLSLFWIVSAFFIPHSLASLALAFKKKKIEKPNLLLVSCFSIAGVFALLVSFTSSVVLVCIYHMFIGLGLGFIFPQLLGLVIQVSPLKLRTTAMGFFQSVYALGIFLGPFFAGIVAEQIGLSEVFLFTSLLALCGVVVVVIRKRLESRDAQQLSFKV
ncbi:MFS transporter [Bacillus solitudinis]|uniref:MFS transporter n=1 Tax=Bacillus solitudinis TaxID=2014074 RepID=UPI0012FE0026|nr:MFS transporter [Bacillus solitudinis]